MMERSVFRNAAWIMVCRVAQALLSLLVGLQTARYLGPSNYGLISYAASLTAFVVPLMQLGFRSTLVRELVSKPEREGQILGTALVLNLVGACVCVAGIFAFVFTANRGQTDTVLVCMIYSLCLIFQALEMIQYWFQAKLLSKYTAIISVAAYAVTSAYKIWLLAAGKSVYWFAFAQSIDCGIIAAVLLFLYLRRKDRRLHFSLKRGKQMLAVSKYYILSGLMVTVFAHTDSVMLKHLCGEAAAGYYTAAVTCAGCSGFVFTALIDSMRPQLLRSECGEEGVKGLASLVLWLALGQSVVLTLLARPLIGLLYGDAYRPAVPVLRLLTWYSAFSYLGAVRNIWILAKGEHRHLWVVNLVGAAGNVALNALLIPSFEACGAAVASVLTQFVTNVLLGWLIPSFRPWQRLLLRSIHPRHALGLLKAIQNGEKKENGISIQG